MINNCCICGRKIKKAYQLPFYDLLGSGTRHYVQNVAVCPSCGFIFTQNPFTEEQLESRYKEFSKFEYDAANYDYVINTQYKSQCVRQKHFIDEAVGEDGYNSVLEVGAASGYNLYVYKKSGKRVKGIEPSALNCRLAADKYNVGMFQGMFQEYVETLPEERFDLIFLSMVLEHIVDPYRFICECAKLTDKYIFIEVPTLDYKVEEEPFGMFCEEHVNMFTRESLTSLMRAAGFSPVNEEVYFNERTRLPAGYPALCSMWKKSTGGGCRCYTAYDQQREAA